MNREGNFQNFAFYTLVVIGLAVLVYRLWISAEHKEKEQAALRVLTEDRGELWFDSSTFMDAVVKKHPRVSSTPVHLAVFLNPDSDCPACLFELAEWTQPLFSSDVYGLTLFMPEGVSAQVIRGIVKEYALEMDSIIFYKKTDVIVGFHNLGVFKVVLTQEKGIVWYEKGSLNDKEYKRFALRLDAEIKYYEQRLN